MLKQSLFLIMSMLALPLLISMHNSDDVYAILESNLSDPLVSNQVGGGGIIVEPPNTVITETPPNITRQNTTDASPNIILSNTTISNNPPIITRQNPIDARTGQEIVVPAGTFFEIDKQTGQVKIADVVPKDPIIQGQTAEKTTQKSGLDPRFVQAERAQLIQDQTFGLGIDPLIANQVDAIGGEFIQKFDATNNSIFKSCLVNPFSYNTATYSMNGNAKIPNPTDTKNYTIDKYFNMNIDIDKFNRIKGYLNSGDLRVTIIYDPIVTLCSSYKNFQDYQSSISDISMPVNPPFDSCSPDFDTSYIIAGKFNNVNDKKMVHIPSDNMWIYVSILSDLQKGQLGNNNNISLDGLYESFTISSITTNCKHN